MSAQSDGRRRSILLTRPRDRSEALARDLSASGWRVGVWPVIEIEFLMDAPPDLSGVQAVLFTSARGVEAAGPSAVGFPAFCVGPSTTRKALEAGYAARDAGGDVRALLALVKAAAAVDGGPLVHIRGEDAAGDLAGDLRAEGYEVREAIGYRARASDGPPADVAAALAAGRYDAAAFYSPRSAAIFAKLLRRDWREGLSEATAAAISDATAAALADVGFRRIVTASAPNGPAMRAAICSAG